MPIVKLSFMWVGPESFLSLFWFFFNIKRAESYAQRWNYLLHQLIKVGRGAQKIKACTPVS